MVESENGSCYYRVDGEDRIVEISSNWLSFAQENQAGDHCHPSRILEKKIWDFIAGQETQHLYKLVFAKVCACSKPVSLDFRGPSSSGIHLVFGVWCLALQLAKGGGLIIRGWRRHSKAGVSSSARLLLNQ